MPLQRYLIEPVSISNGIIPNNELNTLECSTNLTLANLIRQLGSLSVHAARLFEELNNDASKLNERAKNANKRIDKIKASCSQLDIKKSDSDFFSIQAVQIEPSTKLDEFYTMKHFKSSNNFDQQIFNKTNMSEALTIMYNNAEPPPDFDKFNFFRLIKICFYLFYTYIILTCFLIIYSERTALMPKKFIQIRVFFLTIGIRI